MADMGADRDGQSARLRVVIAEQRPEVRDRWSGVLCDCEAINIVDISLPTLMALPEVDAELMMGMFAHERYGGRPRLGESQILSTRGEAGMPPWVVTTPPFREPPTDEVYVVFGIVFNQIKHFQQTDRKPEIRTLGVDLAFLNLPGNDSYQEARGLRRAYREFFRPPQG